MRTNGRNTVVRLTGLALLLGAGAALISLASPAAANGPLDALSYEIQTRYIAPDGTAVDRSSPGVLLVPTPVDVDDDLTTGVGGADVLAQLSIDAGRATLRVSTLPNAPSPLPLRFEVILADPRGTSSFRVAYGYDTLTDTAPAVYNSTIQLVGAARITSFALDIESVGAGETLAVIAEVFTAGPNGERLDPQSGRIDYTPVPHVSHFSLLQGSDFGIQQSGIDLVTDIPTKVEVLIDDTQASNSTVGTIVIDKVPNTVSLVLTESDDDRKTWSYQATDRIERIGVDIRDIRNGQVVDDFVINVENMATQVTLIQDSPTHATFTASEPIGAIEAGNAKGGPVRFREEPAYLYSTDSPNESFAFRVLGLSRAELDSGDPFVVDVQMQAGPLHVLIEEGTRTIDAWIRDIPDHVRIALSSTNGTLDWQGSAGIAQVELVGTDPEGIAGRATRLELDVRDMPSAISLAWGADGEAAVIDAQDQRIGSIDLLLTSGPEIAVDQGFDGVVMRDHPDHWALAARLTGLQLVNVSTGEPPYSLQLNKTAGPFLIHLTQGARDTRIELHDLPAAFTASFDPAGTIDYSGSDPIDLVTAVVTDPEGVSGRANRLEVSIADLPEELTIDFRSSGTAGVDAHGERIGSVDVLMTSGPALEVDQGFDGIVLQDVPSHYALAIRLRGLSLASVSTGGAPYTLSMRKDAGPFLVSLQQDTRDTRIEVLDLPASIDATLDPEGTLSYTASDPIEQITARISDPNGVAGRANLLEVDVRDVPAELSVAFSGGNAARIDAGQARIGSIDLLVTSGPRPSVDAGFDGVLLEDVDSHYALVARLTGLRRVDVTTGDTYSLDLRKDPGPFLISLTQGTRVARVEIHDLPDSLQATFDPNGELSYTGSGPIGRITANITDPQGVSGDATLLELDVRELPPSLALAFTSGDTALIDARGDRIGSIELLLTSGPRIAVPDGYDGLILQDVGNLYVLTARVTGLSLVSIKQSAPYSLDIRKDPTPFVVNLFQEQAVTMVEILDLPSSLQATIDPDAGTLSYDASSEIGLINARISDPAGVSGRATVLELRVVDLPASLDLAFGSGSEAKVDAQGGRIGSLDVLLTSGPQTQVPAGFDGLVLEDLADRYVLAARITGLREVRVSQSAPYALTLNKDAGPFHLRMLQGSRDVLVEARDLPDAITATLDPAASFTYDASGEIGSLTARITDPAGVSGRATRLELDVTGLPRELEVGFNTGSRAVISAGDGRIGSIRLLLTSGPVVEVPAGFDGIELIDQPATYALAARVTGLRLVDVSVGAPYSLDLRKDAGPFSLHMSVGARDTRVTVFDLPSSIQGTLDPAAGTFAYTASAPIASLDALVTDPAGVIGRATRLDLDVTGLPATLDLALTPTGVISLDAHGATIGSISVVATSGPIPTLDAGFDGVIYEDMPSHYAIVGRLTGLKQVSVSTGTAPYSLTLRKAAGPFQIRMLQGARVVRVNILNLPDSLTATLDPAGALNYTASATIGELNAFLSDPGGVTGRATKATALLRSLPTTLNVTWAGATGAITADARGQTVGLIEVSLASGAEASLPADRDGLVLEDTTAAYKVFARITGLRYVSFAQGPPPSFRLDTTGGRRFVVQLSTQKPGGVATTTADISNLPSSVRISFTGSTAFTYTATASVNTLQLDAYDPDGISGRAHTLHATLNSLPTTIEASWASGQPIIFDAKGGTVGLVEIQLTSGPDDRLSASYDGLLLNDLADRYVMFARLTNLQRVSGTQQPLPDITINTTGNRILRIELNQLDGSKVEYTRATLDRLPSQVRVRVLDSPGGQQVIYNASARTNSLVFDSNSGDRWNLHASLSNPMPANVTLCSAGNGFCTGHARSAGAGSFLFDASEHTDVDVFDCKRPLNSSCTRGNASEFTDLRDWRVRHVDFDADFDDIGFSGYTWINTNGFSLRGYLLNISGSSGFEANFGDGFWASNRKVSWDAWGLFKSKNGSINCASGTSLSVRVIGIWLGVTSYMC